MRYFFLIVTTISPCPIQKNYYNRIKVLQLIFGLILFTKQFTETFYADTMNCGADQALEQIGLYWQTPFAAA